MKKYFLARYRTLPEGLELAIPTMWAGTVTITPPLSLTAGDNARCGGGEATARSSRHTPMRRDPDGSGPTLTRLRDRHRKAGSDDDRPAAACD